MVAPSLEVESHLFAFVSRHLIEPFHPSASARLVVAFAQRRHHNSSIVLGVGKDSFPRLPFQLGVERLYGIGSAYRLPYLFREIIVGEDVVGRLVEHPCHSPVF